MSSSSPDSGPPDTGLGLIVIVVMIVVIVLFVRFFAH